MRRPSFRRILMLAASPLPLMGTQYVTVDAPLPGGRFVLVAGWRL